MKRILPLIALCFVFTSHCLAHLGETYEECVARYGKPLDPPGPPKKPDNLDCNSANFRLADLLIQITFWKGKAAYVAYSRWEWETGKKPKMVYIEWKDIERILEANRGSSSWEKDKSWDSMEKTYTLFATPEGAVPFKFLRKDGNATATLLRQKEVGYLNVDVKDEAYMKFIMDNYQKKEDAKEKEKQKL